jgi:hypothetical protein
MRRPLRYPVLTAIAAVALVAAAMTAPGAAAAPARPAASAAVVAPALPAASAATPSAASAATPPAATAGTQAAEAAAAASKAKATGQPVTIASMTTPTETTAADPGGELTVTENSYPVRVWQDGAWTPVDTTLARAAGGSLSPAAVPGDTVTFSGGGSGPLATVSAAGTSVSFTWPGTLPAPSVSGSSATYQNVLPGVDLVLTATSAAAGGFSEVLVVNSATAAKNPALATIKLGVTAGGVRLRAVSDGTLYATGPDVPGYYQAAAPMMWDSSAFPAGATPAAMSTMASAARSAGFGLVPRGEGRATSSGVGPAAGARFAAVRDSVTGDGTGLSLTPDAALLGSATTRFPVYIDPTLSWTPTLASGTEQDRDDVQSGCPAASHFDAPDGESDTYNSLGVGFDQWTIDTCTPAAGSTAYAYYQLGVPSQIWGGHLVSAVVDAQEAYSAECPGSGSSSASVTLSLTGGINSGTDWDNAPRDLSDQSTVSVGPNTNGSCDTTYIASSAASNWDGWNGVGFSVMPAMTQAAAHDWRTFTFRLWQQGSPSENVWERFGPAPSMQIQYNQTPSAPTGLSISDGTTANMDCSKTPYPWVGELATSGKGTQMSATVSDKGGDELLGYFKYWENGSSASTTVPSPAAVKSGTDALGYIPASYTNGLADGTEIDWQAYAYDGAPAADGPTGPTGTEECHFYVFPSAPGEPTITGGPSGSPVPGSTVTYTVTPATETGATATAVVWGFDKQPADATPPADQTVSLSGGVAKVTVAIPDGGPHAFYAYAEYSTGPVSKLASSTFSASTDPPVTCASFADALSGDCTSATGATVPDATNTMISTAGTTSGSGGDGDGNSLAASDLTSAGWQPGGTVTVDGATFTLPGTKGGSFSGADNVLSANQTIDLPAGSQGNSLVFLALATNGDVSAPDGPDLPDSQPAPSALGETSAPLVAAGTSIAGAECSDYQVSQQDSSGNPVCDPEPAGTITYAADSAASAESYYLTVPDWWDSAPQEMDAITLPDIATSTGLTSHDVGIYAFSVPLNPGAVVASVQLPDIGAVTSVATGVPWTALHIFGVAVANTTTATPGSTATNAAGPWTGAWASPIEGSFAPHAGTSYSDQTVRIVTQASIGGTSVRLRLSDSLAATGTSALSIGAVTVAPQSSGAATGSPQTVTFGGSTSTSIPVGTDVYSDPVSMAVTPGEYLAVSIYLSGSYPSLPGQTWCSACTEYVTAAGQGNQTGNTDGSVFAGTGTATGDFSTVLTGVDVLGTGQATVAVLGDQVTDGNTTGTPVHGVDRVSDDLASALALQSGGPAFGVVNAGIESNQILAGTDSGTGANGGPSALARLARDVLAEPGIGTVVIDEGTEDLLNGANGEALFYDGFDQLVQQLADWGVTTIVATVPACYGYSPSADPCTTTVDTTRTTLNDDLIGQYSSDDASCSVAVNPLAIPPCQLVADFSGAIGNTASPQQLITPADAGDHVNLTATGYQSETGQIPVIAGEPIPLTADTPPDY